MGSLPRRSVPFGASDRRAYRLRGARGTVRHRPAERPGRKRAKTGKLRAAGSGLPNPADLEFLIATALLTIPRILLSARAVGVETRRGLPPERDPKARYERRRLLAERKIRCSPLPDNQKIEVEEIEVID